MMRALKFLRKVFNCGKICTKIPPKVANVTETEWFWVRVKFTETRGVAH